MCRFPLKLVQGLEAAKPADLTDAQISPSGLGVHFPRLDADLYIPALLEGFLGSRRWMAAQNGRAGGKAKAVGRRRCWEAPAPVGGRNVGSPWRQLAPRGGALPPGGLLLTGAVKVFLD